METEKTNVSLKAKLKFWFLLNWTLISIVSCYYFYQVTVQEKMAVLRIPQLYKDTDFLLEEFSLAYDIKEVNGKCHTVLRPKEMQMASK